MNQEKIKCDSCPECGSKEFINKNLVGDGFRECSDCHQEWWIDIDYERFVDVPEFEGLYLISNHGRIKTIERKIIKKSKLTGTHVWTIKERIRKPSEHSSGYLRINLRKNQKCHFLYIHVLVMRAFKGEKPDDHDVDHRDSNRHNNHLSNLRYLHQTKNRGIPGNQHWKGKSKSIINQ